MTDWSRKVDAVWRIEAPRLLGALIRFTGSVDLAEDLAQEALVAALEKWPSDGIPDKPGAWLYSTAKNRGVDAARRRKMMGLKHVEIAHLTGASAPPEAVEDLGDDVLRLLFIACHPVVAREGRVALTLRMLGGLSTLEIARAFLSEETTIAQRIVRAKKTITAARVPFEVPAGQELRDRLPSVLEVIYLIFNEGYSASAGEDWMRPELCQEAMRLGRILAALVPDEAEAQALSALMELQASRTKARLDSRGKPVLLLDQDRSRWDFTLIRHGLLALERAERLGRPHGVYGLQAAIAACHARARRAQDTDWERIAALYDGLLELTQSPVVALNRAVAVCMAYGPKEALVLVEEIVEEGSLKEYPLLYAVRADVLHKLGQNKQACKDLERARDLTTNQAERSVLIERILRLSSEVH